MNIEDCAVRLIFACFLFLTGFLVSCGGPDTLRVRQFHLRDTKVATGQPFIRAETNELLHGAVTQEERELRLGNYYHVRWRKLSGEEPVKIVFEYRQAKSGAKVFRKEKVSPAKSRGDRKMLVIGNEYLKGGRVTAWRVTIYDGDQLAAQKQSYLWE